MTELKATKIAAIVEQLRRYAVKLSLEFEPLPAWLEVPYKFPDEPTLENVTKTLREAIDWHTECDVRCAYGTYTMIQDTCLWISLAKLTSNQMFELCVLLNSLYHEALGKWG